MVVYLSGQRRVMAFRLLYSQGMMSAQQAMKAEMEKGNLITYFDSVGNLFGRLEGTDPPVDPS